MDLHFFQPKINYLVPIKLLHFGHICYASLQEFTHSRTNTKGAVTRHIIKSIIKQ